MRPLSVVATGIAALAMTGCVTTGTANVDRGYQPASAGKGLMVASVSVSGYVPGVVWFQVVDAAGANPVSIPVNDSSFDLDWPAGQAAQNGTGRLAVVELAPGSYELRRWVMNVSNRAAYTSVRPFGYRFSVSAGKATYLGGVHVDIQQSAASSLPYAVTREDRRERDLPLLQRKYPGLRADAVVMAVAEQTEPESRPVGARSPRMDDLQGLLPK